MKSPRLIAVAAFLIVGVAVLFDVSSAPAQPAPPPFFPPMGQPYHMQPPFFAPKKCSLYGGLFYLDGGVAWRRLLQVELKIIETQPLGAQPPGFGGNVFGLSAQPLGNEAWGPTFEAGYQAGDFFDLFAGFSWYSITDPFHRRLEAIDLDGNLDLLDITYNLNFTVNEFRTGGRSWVPLFGIGRMGVTLGMITSYIPYQIDVNRQTSRAATGAIIDAVAGHQADYWVHFAAFGGIDVELGFNIFFVRASLQGSIGSYQAYEDTDRLSIETRVNPSAVSLSATGGIRF